MPSTLRHPPSNAGPVTAAATVRPHPLLRGAWWADAAISAVMGAAMALAAGPIAGRTGLAPTLLEAVGVSFAPYVAFLAWLATRPAPATALAWAPVPLNVAWALACVAYGASLERPSGAALAFVALHVVGVLGLAALQAAGLRRSPRAQ